MPDNENTTLDQDTTTAAPATPEPPAPAGEQLGETGMKALEKERQLRREAEKKLTDQQEAAENAKKSESERLTAERDTARQEAQEARLETMRIKVGTASGLPQELVDRLTGDTEEEMKVDAERLAKALGQSGGGFDGGARGTNPKPSDMNSIIRRAAGR